MRIFSKVQKMITFSPHRFVYKKTLMRFLFISGLMSVCLMLSIAIQAQVGNGLDPVRQKYIEDYAGLAVEEMQKSGIPASITMAQALLESSNGRSELARTANNHFGIKCHKTWTGRRFYYDDDNLNDCFRAYKSIEESFRDHSLFLLTRARYNFLFDLDPSDYIGWARGLKQAGYATNPIYADQLITIIEDNELYRLDKWISGVPIREEIVEVEEEPLELPEYISSLPIHTRNRIKFVVAGPDDSIEKITRELNKLRWEIRNYNEIPRRGQIEPGQIVYLQPKRRKAARGFDIHYVSPGETWYSISQHYGIKLKWLYKRNHVKPGTPVFKGQKIYLRGKKPEFKPPKQPN